MAQFWLDQLTRVEFDAMNCFSIAQSQLGPVNMEHNNGDNDDGGQGDHHDIHHDRVHNL